MKEVENLEKSKSVMNIKGCDIMSTMYHADDDEDEDEIKTCQQQAACGTLAIQGHQ